MPDEINYPYGFPYYSNMPNDKYWKQRAKETLNESFKTADAADAYMEEVYKKSLIDFCDKYNKLVAPYVKNGVLDKDALNMAYHSDPEFQYKYRRLQDEITSISDTLGNKEEKRVQKTLETVYKNTMEETIGKKDLYKLDKFAVEQAVKTPWTKDGREFSGRIWKDKTEFQQNLRATLSNAMSKGESIQKSVKEFKRIYGNTTFNTSRLIRTETLAIHNKASVDSYKALGMEYLEVLPEADACSVCQEHAGKLIPVEEANEGWNIPPFHPNCKCCVMPVVKRKEE